MNLGGRGCSVPRPCQCTTAWVTEPDSVSKKKVPAILPLGIFLRETLIYEYKEVLTRLFIRIPLAIAKK